LVDAFLAEWIDLASGRVEDYICNKVQPVEVEEILDGDDPGGLTVTFWPVQALAGEEDADKLANLQYRNSPVDSWVNVLTDTRYLRIDPRKPWELQVLGGFGGFPKGTANIRVKYIAGYDPLPADLQQIVIEMVAKAYQQSKHGEGSLGVASKSVGSAGVSPSTSFLDLEPKWKSVLDRYRSLV
jgi:hypothetical protein